MFLVVIFILITYTQILYNIPEVFTKQQDISNIIQVATYKNGDIIGRILIPKINVDLPIIENASQENLKIGAVHISETPYPWEIGNCFISAHRSWTYGKLFNRLEELNTEDIIQINTSQGNFIYKIYKIEIVLPNNNEVFYQLRGKHNITLTTCTPLYKATHRLIVYGEII